MSEVARIQSELDNLSEFPIPMRGNEFWTERAMIRGRLVSDPHEG